VNEKFIHITEDDCSRVQTQFTLESSLDCKRTSIEAAFGATLSPASLKSFTSVNSNQLGRPSLSDLLVEPNITNSVAVVQNAKCVSLLCKVQNAQNAIQEEERHACCAGNRSLFDTLACVGIGRQPFLRRAGFRQRESPGVAGVLILRAEARSVGEEHGPDGDGRRAIRDNEGVGAEALVVCGVELGACRGMWTRVTMTNLDQWHSKPFRDKMAHR
jgi:hypothetical protein